MPASIAATLYAAHRSALPDPTSVPAWGNAPTEEREAWEAVARVAARAVLERAILAAIDRLKNGTPLSIFGDPPPTEEQTAERIAAWLETTTEPNDPHCAHYIAAQIRAGAWKNQVHLFFATEPAASTPDLHDDIIDPAAARRAAEEFGGFGWAAPYRGPTTCYSQPPCGRCTTCALQAAIDNAARDQSPAFIGTIEQLAAHINALDAADRIRLGAATRTLTAPHRIACATCGKWLVGGHERDGSDRCWGHEVSGG